MDMTLMSTPTSSMPKPLTSWHQAVRLKLASARPMVVKPR